MAAASWMRYPNSRFGRYRKSNLGKWGAIRSSKIHSFTDRSTNKDDDISFDINKGIEFGRSPKDILIFLSFRCSAKCYRYTIGGLSNLRSFNWKKNELFECFC